MAATFRWLRVWRRRRADLVSPVGAETGVFGHQVRRGRADTLGDMFQPCSVCMHARRFQIDLSLAKPGTNVSGIAGEYGLSRYSLQSHRKHHVPACLAKVHAWADTGRLTGHRRKVGELYVNALGALATAEHGALTAGTKDSHAAPAVSMTTIARKIREARAGLDQLMRLAADAAEQADRPQDLADAALNARIQEQWIQELANRPMPSERAQ